MVKVEFLYLPIFKINHKGEEIFGLEQFFELYQGLGVVLDQGGLGLRPLGHVDGCVGPAAHRNRLTDELGLPYPEEGLAALRMWGQTGDRPRAWIAAADPVYMEPQLDRLFLHVLGPGDVSKPELRLLFDALQAALGGDGSFGFARLGSCGYIRSEQPMVTSAVPAALLWRPAAAKVLK